MRSRKKWKCLDCGVDTGKIYEHYFVHTDLWLSVVGSNKGMLCIKDFEKRLGRQLNHADFPDVIVNSPSFEPKSDRLLSRIYAPGG